MTIDDLYSKLRAPFDIRFISWKINNYNAAKTKAMITFHIDARAVQHRLNKVLGVDGWSFSFTEIEKEKGVHGSLIVYFRERDKDECITIKEIRREDVGFATTTAKDEWYKDAVSDALKRCAVHFGVGHFLYALPYLWIDLKTPGQKYLDDDQNDYCRNWLQSQIERMKVSQKSSKSVSR